MKLQFRTANPATALACANSLFAARQSSFDKVEKEDVPAWLDNLFPNLADADAASVATSIIKTHF